MQSLPDIPISSCTLGSLALHLRELLPRMPFSHLGKVAKALSTLTQKTLMCVCVCPQAFILYSQIVRI